MAERAILLEEPFAVDDIARLGRSASDRAGGKKAKAGAQGRPGKAGARDRRNLIMVNGVQFGNFHSLNVGENRQGSTPTGKTVRRSYTTGGASAKAVSGVSWLSIRPTKVSSAAPLR